MSTSVAERTEPMSTITLQSELMEQVEQVAAEQAVMPSELLEAALSMYLRQMEREKIKAEVEAFRSLHPDLIKKYTHQYVAMRNGEVVDHDEDFQLLHNRVRQRFGRQPVLLRRVETEPERELVFRSPRFE